MTSLLEGAKQLVTRGTDIGARIEGLDTAARTARGRLDDTLVDEAQDLVDRAAGRLRLSAGHTVVAIAGATGSGKSSTFNALTGLELSAVGVRRPTTSWASACVWGRDGADELLAWLGIPPRHQTTRDSMLDTGRRETASELDGVVLLDLPDHDSTEVSHHLEVDRLVALADLLVWVLDPQKYADAAIHDRYLAPSAEHQDVMLVVLNQIDTVPEERRQSMLDDIRRLLDADGLDQVPVLAVSARDGVGIVELRAEIARRAAEKQATSARVDADVKAVAGRISAASGDAPTRALSAQRAAALDDAFAEAAGVPTVVEAVDRSTRMRVGRATGWPVIGLLSGVRPDPVKRLQLDLGTDGRALSGRARTALPEA
ncbi:MAG: putative transporter, partial [Nocardioides sp.]|nr:putative transporter [Nocardioides sp.]